MSIAQHSRRPKTDEDFEQLYPQARALWYTALTTEELAAELNTSVRGVYDIGKRYNLPKRAHVKKKKNRRKDIPDPTPEELEARVKEIQAGWTDEEREARASKRACAVTIKNFVYSQDTRRFAELSHPKIAEE